MRAILFLIALFSGVDGRPDAGPPRSWKLAYVFHKDIWTANGDGTGRKLLVKDGRSPCWSPDKKRVAFARNGDVWVIDVEGHIARRLTVNWKPAHTKPGYSEGREVTITWDPISGNIYFSHWEEFLVRRPSEKTANSIPSCTIFELSPKGGAPVPRLDILDDEARFHTTVNNHPAFSRNGKFLAFVRNGDVWLADRNGSEYSGYDAYRRGWVPWDMTRLQATANYDAPNYRGSRENEYAHHVALSTDARLLAYSFGRINGSGTRSLVLLHVKYASGTHTVTKEEEIGEGFDPCFSPDSKWIAYWGFEPKPGIYAQAVVGGSARLLIPDGEEPAW